MHIYIYLFIHLFFLFLYLFKLFIVIYIFNYIHMFFKYLYLFYFYLFMPIYIYRYNIYIWRYNIYIHICIFIPMQLGKNYMSNQSRSFFYMDYRGYAGCVCVWHICTDVKLQGSSSFQQGATGSLHGCR